MKNRRFWIIAVAASVALAVLPAQAASVTPLEVVHSGGGGAADCYAADVNSSAEHAFWISNPPSVDGVWVTDPATGAQFKLEVNGRSSFDFEVLDTPPALRWRVADIVVKGSKGSNWYNYDATSAGVASDTNLTAPRNGNLSHVSFCYSEETFDGEISCNETENPSANFATTRGNDYNTTGTACKGEAGELLYNYVEGVIDDEDHPLDGHLFVDFTAINPNPLSIDGKAQFLETITWHLSTPAPGATQFAPLHYDDHLNAGLRLMPWCKEDPRAAGALGGGINPSLFLPTGHTSCLVESSTTTNETVGSLISRDIVYTIVDGTRAK